MFKCPQKPENCCFRKSPPRIRSAVPYGVRTVDCEDHKEIILDKICMAAKLYDNAEKAGKTVTPGNSAYYAILHAKSGPRSYGQSESEPQHPAYARRWWWGIPLKKRKAA